MTKWVRAFKRYFVLSCLAGLCAVPMAQQQDVPVQWPVKEMSTVDAALAVAQTHSGVIILEAWHDQTITKQVEYRSAHIMPGEIKSGYADEITTNPARIIIPKPQAGLNTTRAIDHIVGNHGHLQKLSKDGSNITDLVRKELLNNPNWPLNKKLDSEHLTKPLTVKAAADMLSNSYGMLPIKDPYEVFGIERQTNEVTLDTAVLQDGTVRDLIFKLIETGGAKSSLFHVLPMPEPSDADYSTATGFKWSIRELNP